MQNHEWLNHMRSLDFRPIKVSLLEEVEKGPLEEAIDKYLEGEISIDQLLREVEAEKRNQDIRDARIMLRSLKKTLDVDNILKQIKIIKGDEEYLK